MSHRSRTATVVRSSAATPGRRANPRIHAHHYDIVSKDMQADHAEAANEINAILAPVVTGASA